jgi:hypothetical protein
MRKVGECRSAKRADTVGGGSSGRGGQRWSVLTNTSLRNSAPPLDTAAIVRRGESLRSARRIVALGGVGAAIVLTVATVVAAPWNLGANDFAPDDADRAHPITPTAS